MVLNNITLLSDENVEKKRSTLQQEPVLCFKTFLISRVKINKTKKIVYFKFSPDLLIHDDDYITRIMSRRDNVNTDAC